MNIKLVLGASALCFGLGVASRASADGGPSSAIYEASLGYTTLFSGQQLISDSGYYHLEMQGDGNLVEYADCGNNYAVWSSQQNGQGGNDFWSPYMAFQQDGNFVEIAWSGTPLWATGPTFGGGGALWLQDDGNIVIYPNSGGVAFASGTHGNHGNPHCSETASYTQVFPGWGSSTSTGSIPYGFSACGTDCAQNSSCLGFVWHSAVELDGDCIQFYTNSVQPQLIRADGWQYGMINRGIAPSGG